MPLRQNCQCNSRRLLQYLLFLEVFDLYFVPFFSPQGIKTHILCKLGKKLAYIFYIGPVALRSVWLFSPQR